MEKLLYNHVFWIIDVLLGLGQNKRENHPADLTPLFQSFENFHFIPLQNVFINSEKLENVTRILSEY